MRPSRHPDLAPAVAAVRRAARVCRAVQRRLATAEALQKKDRSPVTVADFASQAVVCAALAEAFPRDPIVAEEGTGELREAAQAALRAVVVEEAGAAMGGAGEADILSAIDRGASGHGREDRFWTLDPIDGTKGFLRGEQYAVALALIERGQIVLGVLACPNLLISGGSGGGGGGGGVEAPGLLAVAVRGQGTRLVPLDDESHPGWPAQVSTVTDPAEARFCESVESGHSDQDASAQIARRLGITAAPLRMDSQAKYATVARGDASIYLRLPTPAKPDYREMIWDHAAGVLVVEEAGGRVTDIEGRPLAFGQGRRLESNRGVIATNGAVHDAVLHAVRAVAPT